jgi:hypothetical protein
MLTSVKCQWGVRRRPRYDRPQATLVVPQSHLASPVTTGKSWDNRKSSCSATRSRVVAVQSCGGRSGLSTGSEGRSCDVEIGRAVQMRGEREGLIWIRSAGGEGISHSLRDVTIRTGEIASLPVVEISNGKGIAIGVIVSIIHVSFGSVCLPEV